jgi:hypothetical protein
MSAFSSARRRALRRAPRLARTFGADFWRGLLARHNLGARAVECVPAIVS